MPSIKVLAEGRRRTKPFHFGVYVNLVDGDIWDVEVVGSSPATPTCGRVERNTIPGSYPERYWVRLPGSATENIIRLVTANFL